MVPPLRDEEPPPLDMDEPLLLEGGVYVLPDDLELPLSVRRLGGGVAGLDELDLSVVVGLETDPWFVVVARLLVELRASVTRPELMFLFPSDVVPLREVPMVLLESVPTRFDPVVVVVPLRLLALDPVTIRPLASRLTAVEPRLDDEDDDISLLLELAVLELKRSRFSDRTVYVGRLPDPP